MTIAAFRNSLLSAGAVVVGTTLLVATSAVSAQAESSNGLSGTAPIMRGASGRQLWRISDYTTIELVAREPGAPANQHPWTIEPNTLHALLQQVNLAQAGRGGLPKPLFAIDELNNLVPAITEALANARPDQDIALVSSARHEDNSFYSVTAVTARLFVVDGHLNMVVHDARVDFYDNARGTGMAPHFTIGSRNVEGNSPVQSTSATNRRSDWLVLAAVSAPPAASVVPVAAAMPVAPAAPPAPVAAPPAVVAPVVAAPLPPAATPAPAAPVDAEQRLVQLKRLYDKGLITKSEYEKKRAEIIKGL